MTPQQKNMSKLMSRFTLGCKNVFSLKLFSLQNESNETLLHLLEPQFQQKKMDITIKTYAEPRSPGEEEEEGRECKGS